MYITCSKQSSGEYVNELVKVDSIKCMTILDGWKESTWEIQIDTAEVNIESLRSEETDYRKLEVFHPTA